MVHDCIASVRNQVDHIIVVANGGYDGSDLHDVLVVPDAGTDRNISRWWNIGLCAAAEHERHEWNSLVLNDDVVMHPGSVTRLSDALRETQVELAFPGPTLARIPFGSPVRITGWCFMLAGEHGLCADETMSWWASDNDLDWRARQRFGVVTVPNVGHDHRDANGYTNRVPALSEQAGRDLQTFQMKWGKSPC
jgi:hypothetical protein